MNVGWLVAAIDAMLAARATEIDGGFHADQQDSALGWIVCFRAGRGNGPPLFRRCPADEPAATRLCRSEQVPKYTTVQRGLLDPMRPTRSIVMGADPDPFIRSQIFRDASGFFGGGDN